ncbi:NAD(P)-dependent alcohol dehydrogenase [Blastococcus sp. CT_GayMR19]|uniref:NAD(P)-dependent alcohol dehydrogenase n=1 Tax=Blastococcus sp. CT_GayMR19 TaxID=2559608 RepID=UPI001FD75C83|nr:NAD(P)-dependent alcohol dehydrogenase [Blastococcus sp. CT_GayMR19]
MRTESGTPDAGPATTAGTMRAIVQDAYGEADVLRLAEIDRPTIGTDEVLVRVHAAGVDQGAWHLMAGLPYPIRLAGYGFRTPKTPVRGRELAGRVEAVGRDVTTLRPGDEVYGVGEGTFAEYARAAAGKLAPRPANLTFRQAAALPISGTTALQAVRDHGHVQPGQRVLVIGAAGGVGSYAVQIAKAFGAEVTGVVSTGKVDLVRSLGADHVVDYRLDDDLAAGERRYDVILDTGGNRPLRTLRRALTPTGTLVIVGAETGGRWLGGLDRQLRAMALSPLTRQRLGSFIASENAADLAALTDLVESGAVTPVVDRAFPLVETPAALRHLREGRARGKVVIDL